VSTALTISRRINLESSTSSSSANEGGFSCHVDAVSFAVRTTLVAKLEYLGHYTKKNNSSFFKWPSSQVCGQISSKIVIVSIIKMSTETKPKDIVVIVHYKSLSYTIGKRLPSTVLSKEDVKNYIHDNYFGEYIKVVRSLEKHLQKRRTNFLLLLK
jgi:hypothetical protein